MKVFHYSDIGSRTNNEDYISFSDFSFVLCDGVGGIDFGEIASKIVCETFIKEINCYNPGDLTVSLINKVNTKVQIELNKLATERPELNGIGTTFCAVVFSDDKLFCAHAGDSRIYIIDTIEEKYWRATDHSLSNELINSGILKESNSRNHPFTNQLTRAFQANPDSEFTLCDIQQFKNIDSGKLIFICSDGVNEVYSDLDLMNILCSKNLTAENKFSIIQDNCKNYSNDNNSAILIQPETVLNTIETQIENENLWIYLNRNSNQNERNIKKWWKLF